MKKTIGIMTQAEYGISFLLYQNFFGLSVSHNFGKNFFTKKIKNKVNKLVKKIIKKVLKKIFSAKKKFKIFSKKFNN